MKKKALLLSLVVISLFSCNDVSNFLFDTSQSVEIRSVDNGALLSGDSSFPLDVVSHSNAVPDSYTVTIFDESGVNWGKTTVQITDQTEEYSSSLVVPADLPAGKYIFRIQVFENSEEIASKEVTIFKVDGEYAIKQLVSIPHETEPGKDVFINADLSYPDGSDPFLRWSLNGTVLKEGLLSEGLNNLHWIANKETGIYTISLEMFPEPCSSDFVSSVKNSADIVVSESSLGESGALIPEDSYSLLYHFNGSLTPVHSGNFVTALTGTVGAQPVEDSFYYTLSGNTGISSTGIILPSQGGVVTPFSINARIAAINPLQSGPLFRVFDGENMPLSLSLSEAGHLVMNIEGKISTSRFALSDMTNITIHVIPGENGTEIRWFSNGFPAGSDFLMTGPLTLSDNQQRSVLGGDDSVESCGVILDEFGIFTGDGVVSTVDAEQFSRVEGYKLGDNLISADGFDGIQSGLTVIPGSISQIGSFSGSQKNLEAVLAFSSSQPSDRWEIVLKDDENREIARIPQSALVQVNDSDTAGIVGKVRFSINSEGDKGILKVEGVSPIESAQFSYSPGTNYSLFLETDVDNKNDVVLDYYIVYSVADTLLSEPVASA